MEPDFRVTVGQTTSVEWRIGKKQNFFHQTTPQFTIGFNRCSLEFLNYGDEFNLYLRMHGTLLPALLITTYLSRDLDLILPQTNIANNSDYHLVWKISKSLDKHLFSQMLPQSVWYFRFFFVPISDDSKVHPGDELHGPKSGYRDGVETLIHDLHKMQNDSSDHDVRLRCDGEVLSAHKIFLSARSEVFKAMLQADMQENRTGLVDIKDMAFPALQHFLAYLYTGTLPDLTVDLAVQLYEAGDKYAVGDLKESCSEFLKVHLGNDNVLKILLLADAHSDFNLKERTFRYITDKEIPKKWGGWRDFSDGNQKLAFEVLNYYALNK